MKKYLPVIFLTLFVFFTIADAYAQRRPTRSTRTREPEPTTRFTDNLVYDINLGNIGFGTGFSISFKPAVGYKLAEIVTLGGGFKGYYLFSNRFGVPDESFFDYGPLAFGRINVTPEIFVQGEYNFMSYDFGANADRQSVSFPLVGAGYMSGFGPWKYGLQLLFIADELARDYQASTVEYWFTFSYNF